MSLRELRHGQFLLNRRLSYQAMVLCGIAYVFDTRGFWLLAMAAIAAWAIWLRRAEARDAAGAIAPETDVVMIRWDLDRRLAEARRAKSWSLGLAAMWAVLGLLGRVTAFPEFWVTSLVLTAGFIASAGRWRDLAALLDRERAALSSSVDPEPAHHDAR